MNEIQEALDKAMPNIARRLLNELVITCPFDTGRLRNSLKVKSTKEGLIIWGVDYLQFVEFGTPPHVIKPKNKEALKFELGKKARLEGKKKGKNIIFAKEIHHPGSRPNSFVRNAIQNKLGQIIIEEINKQF